MSDACEPKVSAAGSTARRSRAGLRVALCMALAAGAAGTSATVSAQDSAHEHAGATNHVHGTGSVEAGTVIPPITPEDRAAAFPELGDMSAAHGTLEDPFNTFVLLDRLEVAEPDGIEQLDWEVSAWAGRSLRRLWLRSEGERHGGETEHADLELLGGLAVTRWWDLVAGIRHDIEPGSGRTWAAVGVQGLAPYGFELEATAYVAEGGRAAARLEAEHELPITPRLILEPALELNWHGSADPERGIGRGLSSGEAALRVRYELRREIAPYFGIVWEKAFGDTADLYRVRARDSNETMLVAGIRLWF